MHGFLKRVKPEEGDSDTKKMLEKIQSRCKDCQHLAPKPYVTKVAIPQDDGIFNSEVIFDVMYIQGRPVLHCVDRAKDFQSARFLEDISTENLRKTFMQMWCLIYLGSPDNLRHDQGTQFTSPKLQQLAAEAGISCRSVGVESANAMSVGECHHEPLRDTFLNYRMHTNRRLSETVEELVRGKCKKKPIEITVDDEYLLDGTRQSMSI